MSKIALAPNANGTGTFTLSAPNGNTSRTMVLPDADGTLITTTSALDASKLTGNVSSALLTGALPAISGAALTGITSTTIYDTGSFDIANSTQYSFTHGLGSIPDFCAVYLVCIASFLGFSVGDIIQISAQGNVDSGDEGTHIELTATTFIVRIGSNGPAEYVRKNSFATAALSSNAFNMQIKAFKF